MDIEAWVGVKRVEGESQYGGTVLVVEGESGKEAKR